MNSLPSESECLFSGKQNTTPNEVMKEIYFVTDEEWMSIKQSREFDYIVIGSSYCALGFITKVAENNPNAKILVLERGQYFHPCHFQNLSPVYKHKCREASETLPWTLTEKTKQGKYIRSLLGMCNFFGGKSLFWSGWCPEPTSDEMEHWPHEVIKVVHDYFGEVKELLNVTSADQIFTKQHSAKPVYGKLQEDLQHSLQNVSQNIEEITRMIPAPLSVMSRGYRYQDFKRDSVPEKLLEILLDKKEKSLKGHAAPLKVCIDCTVQKILHDGKKKATGLETSLGNVSLGNAKLILAMGTLPPTTLMLNSFRHVATNIGKRYTAHFMSGIFARVPRVNFLNHKDFGDLEMAAFYIPGVNRKSNHQFHIQLVAISDTDPDINAKDSSQFYPALHTPQYEQLSTSKEHVIIACSALGQMDHCNEENWLRLNGDGDITTNVDLQSITNKVDDELWDTMDSTVFKVIEQEIACRGNNVEYWHPGASNSGSWKKAKPTRDMIRKHATFHEASTMWIGADDAAPVGLDYRPKGVDNVYVTGGSLHPTGASWNPTGVMVAMAMHLGDLLEQKIKICS